MEEVDSKKEGDTGCIEEDDTSCIEEKVLDKEDSEKVGDIGCTKEDSEKEGDTGCSGGEEGGTGECYPLLVVITNLNLNCSFLIASETA